MMGIALAAFDLEVAARTGVRTLATCSQRRTVRLPSSLWLDRLTCSSVTLRPPALRCSWQPHPQAGEVTLLHLQAALMAAISDMCNALERPSFKADPVAALEAVEGYWDKLLLPAPAPTPSPPQAAPAPAPPQQRAPSGQFAQPAPALTPHAVAKALAFGSQPDAPLPSRLAVVASDPELRTSVCVAIIAATSQGVQITTVPFASVDEAVDDEAPVMVLCTDGSDVPTNLPPCAGNGAPRGYVVYGEVDAPFREGIFSSMHRWCDLVRGAPAAPQWHLRASLSSLSPRWSAPEALPSRLFASPCCSSRRRQVRPPLVVPELVCRIRRVYASVQLMAPLAGIQARFVQ